MVYLVLDPAQEGYFDPAVRGGGLVYLNIEW
jgi:hypothetical protein